MESATFLEPKLDFWENTSSLSLACVYLNKVKTIHQRDDSLVLTLTSATTDVIPPAVLVVPEISNILSGPTPTY